MALNSSIVAAGDVTLATQYNNVRKDVVVNAGDYATSTGAANTYAVTLDGQITAYAAGLKIRVKINVDNTGASTINVNSLGAKTIKKNAGAADVAAGDLQQDGIYDFVYDGTNFQVQALAVSGLPSVATEGDILYFDGTAWALLGAGSIGQILQTNGLDTPSWVDNLPDKVIRSATSCKACDDLGNIPVQSSTNVLLYNGAAETGAQKSIGGALQQVLTIDSGTSAIVHEGYLYFRASSVFYRCLTTSDIANAANHDTMTLSGFPGASNFLFAGIADGHMWFTDTTNSQLIKASISGTTLTLVSTVTVTGASYNIAAHVSDQGIWMPFGSSPYNRHADLTGTLTGKQIRGGVSSASSINGYLGYPYLPGANTIQSLLY